MLDVLHSFLSLSGRLLQMTNSTRSAHLNVGCIAQLSLPLRETATDDKFYTVSSPKCWRYCTVLSWPFSGESGRTACFISRLKAAHRDTCSTMTTECVWCHTMATTINEKVQQKTNRKHTTENKETDLPSPHPLSHNYFLIFFSSSPWYNCKSWQGVKHQVTYFYFFNWAFTSFSASLSPPGNLVALPG